MNYGLIKEDNFTIILCKKVWIFYGILMYLTANEDQSVVAERCIRTLKGKIYKKVKTNDSKSYLDFLNKLVDEYNNTYCSIGKGPIDDDDSAFTHIHYPLTSGYTSSVCVTSTFQSFFPFNMILTSFSLEVPLS